MAATALARGEAVLFNSNPYDQWDLLIGGKRFQVKLAYHRSDRKQGSLYVDVMRTTKWQNYTEDAADFLAVVVPGEIWVIPWQWAYNLGRVSTKAIWRDLKERLDSWILPFQSTT